MDDLDRRLLSRLQEDFPIAERPYLELGEALGIGEDEVVARLRALVEQGVIRDLSPVFDLRRLGYASTLAALDAPPDRAEAVVALINAHPEVTHNYLREGRPNLWFTVIAPSEADVGEVLADIEREAGCGPVHNLPARRMFKARVVFDLAPEGPNRAGAPPDETAPPGNTAPPDDTDWDVIEQLQEGIPLTAAPFAELAARAGMATETFLKRLRGLRDSGIARRMGVRVRHHRAGIAGNILSVWRVAEADTERVGSLFADLPEVTHCYVRDTFPGFPYNLYAMVSALTPEQAEAALARMAAASGIAEYVALKTGRELKKSTPRYRRPSEWPA